MAYTKFTGKSMLVTHGAITLEGITAIEIDDKAKAPPEKIDTTTAVAVAYEFTADPLDSKGAAHSTVTVTCLDSNQNFTDTKMDSVVVGTSGTLLVQPAGSDAGGTKGTVTARLQQRRTVVPVDAYATTVYTFEADAAITWATI